MIETDGVRGLRQHDRQPVHDEAGVDARADERALRRSRRVVEAVAELRVAGEGVGELLASGDDVEAESERLLELRGDAIEVGAGGVEEDGGGGIGKGGRVKRFG